MVTLQLPAPVSPAAVTHFPDPASFAVRETTPAEPSKPRLLDRVRAALRARHDSRRTEEAYVAWIKRYIVFFHAKRHPAEMGAPEVTRFLSSLAVDGRVAASTQNQALSALLFLYLRRRDRPTGRTRRCRATPRAATSRDFNEEGNGQPQRGVSATLRRPQGLPC